MIRERLNGKWKMRRTGGVDWQEAVVPGTVYTDLLRNKNMPDPFWKDNEDGVCELMEYDYEYETVFAYQEKWKGCGEVLLQFQGVDTIADIYMNNMHLGCTENMHRIWEFAVAGFLKEGDNTLRVVLHSPLKYIAEAYKKYGNIGNDDTLEGFMHIRKAHFMFGWDWGAHLPDAGIFRPVYLLGIEKARIDSVYIRQRHEDSRVRLEFEVSLLPNDIQNYTYTVSVFPPDGERIDYTDSPKKITIETPKLWWPNGLGEQPLYRIRVSLYLEGREVDIWEKSIGLRTLTMRVEKDRWGESFAHEINGKTIFAMGSDYIPEDHLLGRVNTETTRELLMQCKQANFNAIRVWGGGYYPDDWFYDICDELGLIVWQDFMFACSVYELTPEFEANIRKEFADNIKRIRNHACLGLWCGNNEMEMFVDERCWVTKPTEVRDYLFMYERIIPEVLKEYDPETFYWPASPSSGGSFDFPNDPNRGDVHYWKVWHGNRPFSEYRKYFFRYASEFGFQSLPSVKTLEQITDDTADLNMFSYVMEKHQRNYGANGKIMGYMQQTYLYPSDFSTLVYASQLLQADAIRYGVEHFRRNRGRCMGAIFWQLNDCWPVISWSSIDYCGRWKALQYYAKRFFAPLLLSCEERSWMTQEANMNRQHFEFEKSVRFNVSNETLTDRKVLLKWSVRNAKAEILRTEETLLEVPALTAVWTEREELKELDVFEQYVSYEAWEGENKLSEGTVIFSYPKYFHYQDPKLQYRIEGDLITVSAGAYAKSVEILNENEDMVLSDNYFDLNGDEKTVRILKGFPDKLKIRSVYNIR